MNAAARLVHQNQRVLSRQLILTYFLTRRQVVVTGLVFLIILSAIALIFVTYHSRLMYASYQHNLVEQNQLQSQNSQLLLERSTLLMQSRVQHEASVKYSMLIPNQRSSVIVKQ